MEHQVGCPREAWQDYAKCQIHTLDTLIGALAARDVQNLTVVSNNAGLGQHGLGTCALPNLTEGGRLETVFVS